MLKIIKKIFSFLAVPGAVIILVPLLMLLILGIPYIQTGLARGITGFLSAKLNTTLSVESIEFSYFNKLTVKNLLIKDQNSDTLIYSPKITAGVRRINPFNGIFHLGKVSVTRPVFALITDSGGTMNLTWYLDKLISNSDSSRNGNTNVRIRRIEIDDGRFALINQNSKPSDIPIDFSRLHVSGINGMVENLSVTGDSVTMEIRQLSFLESNGFRVKEMNSFLNISDGSILFREAVLECDSSMVRTGHIELIPDPVNRFSRFLDEVRLNINILRSSLNSADIRYFVPFLKGYNEAFWLSGQVTGTVSELKGRNIELTYGDKTEFNCDFDLSGLPDIENTFIFLEVNDFRSIPGDVEQISIPGRGNIVIPEPLRKLGIVSFEGTFTGFTTDFVTYGKISTAKGLISTDISMRPEGKGEKFLIRGLMKGTDIDLGSITGNNSLLGNMTVEANVDGFTESFRTFNVQLTGNIDSITINDYIYRNIGLNGSFTDKAWNGNIKIAERNINLDLMGMFDFNRELPEFDFTLNLKNASLHNLNIDRSDSTSAMSLLLTANFAGDNIDNLDGEIRLLNSSFTKYGNELEVYDFLLKTYTENSKPAISLSTDFLEARLSGKYNFKGLKDIISNSLAVLMPSRYPQEMKTIVRGENDFIFEVTFRESDRLNEFLKTGLSVSKNSTITGLVHSDSILMVNASSGRFAYRNNTFSNLTFEAFLRDTTFNSVIRSRNFDLSGISDMKDLNLRFSALPDSFNLELLWDNREKILNKGAFSAAGVFSKQLNRGNRPVLKIDLMPGEIYSRNNLWQLFPSQINIDSTSININNFIVRNNDNYMMIHGKVSEDLSDTIDLRFNGINLSPVNNLYEKKMGNPEDIIHLAIGGTLNGTVSFTDFYKEFMFESDLRLKDFTLLESRYGEIKIISAWNNDKRLVDIDASNNYEGKKMFVIQGTFDPSSRRVDLTADAARLPIDALNPLLSMFASDISGTASGRVRLSGELSKPFLTGALYTENAGMKIDYTQTKYILSDSIRFDRSGIKFNNVQLKDERGNSAVLTGTVNHDHFKNFIVDLSIRTNDCMVLNTRSKDNEMFYGTAFASGVTTLKTTESLIRFDISARTGKNTRFFIPLNTGLSVSENSFISFVQPAAEGEQVTVPVKKEPAASTGLEIAFDLNVTPDAEVQLIMDPKTGDIMKGTGSGNLNISLDRRGNLKIFGDYVIANGSYLFTLGNIINKPFDVESGGEITFNGDVDNADINIKAIYKTKASLYEIMPDLIAGEKQKERIPVECHLLLTGRLFNPVVGFDIYLPTADEETRAYLKSMIKSEEDMSRQFLFLLVMGSFYADQSIANQPKVGSSAVGLTTMEMLSSQLSNWLSQISSDFDISVAYRPGSTNLSNSDELQMALSTQLLNDRVIINGNFDVEGTRAAQGGQAAPGASTITGAFDIEYKINEKIRFRFFNRSNDNFYIDNGIQYTQGLGLFYREDFNRFRDLFKRKPKGDMKKEDEPQP